MKKILVVTPRFPYPEAGADEQDRAEGIRQLQRLGFAVKVLGKYFDWQDREAIVASWEKEGVAVTLVPYQKSKTPSWIFDGAAAEYADPMMRRALDSLLDTFQPQFVWFDYSYLWPLYREVKKRRLPIVVRPINVESKHFLDEDGISFVNLIKAAPKYLSEMITTRSADAIFAITPNEAAWYRAHGARRVVTLPLRALPKKLGTYAVRSDGGGPLHAFFSGSTYTVAHNRKALEFIVRELSPALFQKYGKEFLFHVTGAKLPKDLELFIRDNVIYEGFERVGYDAFLERMDIAVVPSFFGAGMQQKIFEPLARGFPTVTHERGIAGYPFVAGEDYLAAETREKYLKAMDELRSIDKRRFLSENCKKKSNLLFNQQIIDNIVSREFEQLKSIKLKN